VKCDIVEPDTYGRLFVTDLRMDGSSIKSAATEAAEEEDARRRLATTPGFSQKTADNARLTRLLGFTNRVYKVEVGGENYCLRIPGDGAAAKIDRRAEEVNARVAAKAGVAPEVLYFGEDGVMLTRFVEGGLPLRPERIKASEGALQRGAVALRQLHDSGAIFAGTFLPFETIDAYAAALQRLGHPPSDIEQNATRATEVIRRVLEAHPVAPKPCHCDPTGRNLLDTGERVWLVDWEYSGMNDPMWDLAYFAIESLLDEVGDRVLLTAYLGQAPEEKITARMELLKPVCEVQAALWAWIQDAEGKSGGDFSGYAKAAFESAAKRMETGDFSRRLETVRAD
jgi:thiamine kinase-like enzyme